MHEVKDSMVKLFGISGTTYLKINYLEEKHVGSEQKTFDTRKQGGIEEDLVCSFIKTFIECLMFRIHLRSTNKQVNIIKHAFLKDFISHWRRQMEREKE